MIKNLKKIFKSPSKAITLVILSLGAIIILYPLLWMVLSSFKSYNGIYNNIWGLPKEWLIGNYQTAWARGVSDYFVNSVIVTATTVIGVLIIGSLAAYALARYKSKIIDMFFLFIIAGLMMKPQSALIPLFRILTNMNLINTRWALILPYITFRLPLTILLIRSYFMSIPKEIEESAIIDGCSELQIYTKIYLPISKPILYTSLVITTFYTWNEFLFATIFINSEKLKTIPSGLMNFRDALQTNWGVLLAGMVIASLPMVLLLIFLQKHLVRGLSEGSVKG